MVARSRNDLSHIFMAHQNGESFTMRNKGQTEITGDMETEKKGTCTIPIWEATNQICTQEHQN